MILLKDKNKKLNGSLPSGAPQKTGNVRVYWTAPSVSVAWPQTVNSESEQKPVWWFYYEAECQQAGTRRLLRIHSHTQPGDTLCAALSSSGSPMVCVAEPAS